MVGMYGIISPWVYICNLNLTFYVVGFVVNGIGFYCTNNFCKPVEIVYQGDTGTVSLHLNTTPVSPYAAIVGARYPCPRVQQS